MIQPNNLTPYMQIVYTLEIWQIAVFLQPNISDEFEPKRPNKLHTRIASRAIVLL